MKTEAQKSSFIAKTRNLAKSMQEFKLALDEYTATDAGNVLIEADFGGVNAGLLPADMVAFMGAVVIPVVAVIDGVGVNTIIENYKNV